MKNEKPIFDYIFWVDLGSIKTHQIYEHNISVPYQSHIKLDNIKEYFIANDTLKRYIISNLNNPKDIFFRGLAFRLKNKMILDFDCQLKVVIVNFKFLGGGETT